MRNKEQEEMYRGIVNKSKKEVQQHFKNIIDSIEFGAYIKPENYFVSYVFKTDEELEKAKLSGLTNKINKYHIKRLKRNKYPKEAIKDCEFATQEACDREFNGNWFYYYK